MCRCETGPAAFALGSTTFIPAREATSDSTSAVEVTMKMMSEHEEDVGERGDVDLGDDALRADVGVVAAAAAVVELNGHGHGRRPQDAGCAGASRRQLRRPATRRPGFLGDSLSANRNSSQ